MKVRHEIKSYKLGPVGQCWPVHRRHRVATDGVGKDFKQFLAWTAKAAELGHPEAQANLGLLLVQGKDLPKDVSTGVKLVQAAADQGDGFAWSLVGGFHQDGLLPKSPAKAAQAYQQAVTKGYPEARFYLTPALLRTAQIDPAAGALDKDQQDAQSGQALAMLRLADRYADGIGVAEDLAQALLWYGKAAAQGNAVAQGMQGVLLVTGQAGVKDVKLGMAQTERAAAAGDAGAMFNMGKLYANNFFGSDNARDHALEWFQKASKAGHAGAEEVLAGLTTQ
ncbi:MAG: tetratricopeptide repeat protein [Rhodoferax sp.]|nr:tetratricopeptide repeat protein [Rhodoferax sp.]